MMGFLPSERRLSPERFDKESTNWIRLESRNRFFNELVFFNGFSILTLLLDKHSSSN